MSQEHKSPLQMLVEERTGRDLSELLRELYITKRHTQREIAGALKVSRSAVKGWLEDLGITRDDRSGVAL